MIGTKEFARMKKSVIFINTARRKVVDENALIKALRENQIYGAGLDVSHESLEDFTRVCIENIEKFIEGEPQNVVHR
jgi:D-3-phosphoglycerate dehydrogenase